MKPLIEPHHHDVYPKDHSGESLKMNQRRRLAFLSRATIAELVRTTQSPRTKKDPLTPFDSVY